MEPEMNRRLARGAFVVLTAVVAAGALIITTGRQPAPVQTVAPPGQQSSLAVNALERLAVRPRAPKSGYSRKQFSDGWAEVGTCTIRDKILARDMKDVHYRSPGDCTVETGTLNDPYTGKTIHFVRGPSSSAAVQIDHVVAVSDTWQTGAQQLSKSQREQLYNDPLELIAVDGPSNEEKGDGDASQWLPPNTDYDCRYVARQIAVKQKYHLWVTAPERQSMMKVLQTCPGQLLPANN